MARKYGAVLERERERPFFGNTSFFTRESGGDVGTMLPLRALPTLSLRMDVTRELRQADIL